MTTTLEWPDAPTAAMADFSTVFSTGLHITIAGALRETGQEIRKHYEEEVAAVFHFLIPFVIRHPDNWRGPALEELNRRKGRVFP